MERISVGEIRWRGVDAWSVRGAVLELVVTQIGAHIAAIREIGDGLNPLWQPAWPAVTPAKGSSHPETYGAGPEARLLATIVGHNLCIDRFGAPRAGETRPVHGEAGVAEWRVDPSDATAFVIGCDLPEARLHVSRRFAFDGDSVEVRTSVTHEFADPREIEWAEHVTVGDPFLDGALCAAQIDGAWISGDEPRAYWRFNARPEESVDPRLALAVPTAADPRPYGDIVTTRLVKGAFRLERPDLNRALEYEWDANEFPWLCLWTQHRSRAGMPWNGVTRARGMEFSTKPFPEGEPPASRSESYQGRPTRCLVPAGAGLERTFTIRWSRT